MQLLPTESRIEALLQGAIEGLTSHGVLATLKLYMFRYF